MRILRTVRYPIDELKSVDLFRQRSFRDVDDRHSFVGMANDVPNRLAFKITASESDGLISPSPDLAIEVATVPGWGHAGKQRWPHSTATESGRAYRSTPGAALMERL